jgi:oxygen-independent coproporphyrinogen-3 oxidase
MPVSSRHSTAALPAADHAGPAAIYVHWPFCLKKCPYCDFNSHVREEVSHDRWRAALVREIDTFASRFPKLSTSSIFFGGGTPSLMAPETVAAVIERIDHHWGDGSEIEITLEANPSSIEAARFRAYAEAGVNRVSVGIQSLRDEALTFLGRLHTAREALAALEVAQDNFSRVSFDLIYARPQQSLEDWRTELTEALAFAPSHLSLYQLTIEEGTAFYHQFRRGRFSLPDEDAAAALYDLTQDLTTAAGLPAYEISNHARPGEESRHNLTYWNGGFYVGIGPGAHGRLPHPTGHGALAHNQIKRPEDWLAAVEAGGHGTDALEEISAEDRATEQVMMGLRLSRGIDTAPLAQVINRETLDDLVASGHLARSGTQVWLTDRGRPLLNFLLGKLLA